MGEGGNWSMGPGCHGRSSKGFFTPSMNSGSSSSLALEAYCCIYAYILYQIISYIPQVIYIYQKTTLYGCGFSTVSKITLFTILFIGTYKYILFCLLGLTSTSITILWHKA